MVSKVCRGALYDPSAPIPPIPSPQWEEIAVIDRFLHRLSPFLYGEKARLRVYSCSDGAVILKISQVLYTYRCEIIGRAK